MQGLQYYSTWNFGAWLAVEAGALKLSGPVRASIIGTSILGGYMTYIYPRRIIYYEDGQKKVVPRGLAICLDLIGHQFPMYRIYYHLCSKPGDPCICGIYAILPASLYALINYLRGQTLADIYGISSHKLYFSSLIIMSSIGSYFHWNDVPYMYQKILRK